MFDGAQFVDLTHTIDLSIPSWSGSCGFKYHVKRDYDQGVRVLKYEMHGACGTHIDAPSHFIKDGKNVADIELRDLFTPCCVVDISLKRSESLMLSVKDLKDYEASYGKIPKGALVIGYTGWQEFWKDPVKYRNPSEAGGLLFPGFSKEAAEFLVDRRVAGIGIDTLFLLMAAIWKSSLCTTPSWEIWKIHFRKFVSAPPFASLWRVCSHLAYESWTWNRSCNALSRNHKIRGNCGTFKIY